MDPKRFLVTLPSNVDPHGYFPENLISNYITKLPQRFQLNRNWEVGLVEISYTFSWFNLPEKMSTTVYRFNQRFHKFYEDKSYDIGPENFLTVDHILSVLKLALFSLSKDDDETPPSITYNKVSMRFRINMGTDKDGYPIIVSLSQYMWEFLGFDYESIKRSIVVNLFTVYTNPEEEIKLFRYDVTATNPVDLRGTINSIYLYTDIIKPHIVGDTIAPLLRVVEIPPSASFGKQINIKYTNPYYFPLSCPEFETIEIDLKDDTGSRIPFEFGRVIVTLEFREKS